VQFLNDLHLHSNSNLAGQESDAPRAYSPTHMPHRSLNRTVAIPPSDAGDSLRKQLSNALVNGRASFIRCIDEMITLPLTKGLVDETRRVTKRIHSAVSSDGFTQFMLNVIRCDDEWQQQVLLESKVHENGFYKLVLCEGEEFKIRFHVWLPSQLLTAEEHTHDHNWWFHSKTMFGNLPYELLSLSDDELDELAYSYIYEKDSDGQTKGSQAFTVHLQGRVNLRVFESGIHPAGTRYDLHELVKHRILPPREDTATFVMTGPRIRKTCGLYSRKLLTATKDIGPTKIDISTLHHLLDTLFQKLDGGNV